MMGIIVPIILLFTCNTNLQYCVRLYLLAKRYIFITYGKPIITDLYCALFLFFYNCGWRTTGFRISRGLANCITFFFTIN